VADKGEELGSCFCGAGGAAKQLGGVSREVAGLKMGEVMKVGKCVGWVEVDVS